ncbi:MAG: RluA family pseudouridine synthase [Clostridia bacterium]|nr:RluA family pseudouridine synthase [Clostridia bacterium]
METKIIKVQNNADKRIDLFLSENTDYSRSFIKKLADSGALFLNGKPCKCNKTVKLNDEITLNIKENTTLDVKPVNIDIDIVYQDEDLAVINKPQGLVVHSGNGTGENTLVNALLYHLDNLSGINGVIRPGIVHRIDKNTSGLLVVAKNDKSHIALAKQLENKTCRRIYYALLEGEVKSDCGRIETFITRNQKDRTKMAVGKTGRKAITDYKVIKRFENYTLCEFSLLTGRTHQIRVHAKYIGHPVVGDAEYGFKNQKFKLNGQLLHAKKLIFIHPTTNKQCEFECELPTYFTEVLKKLKEK